MHKDNTNKKKGDAKLWYLEIEECKPNKGKGQKKSRKRRVTTRRRKKNAQARYARNGKNVMTRTRREKM